MTDPLLLKISASDSFCQLISYNISVKFAALNTAPSSPVPLFGDKLPWIPPIKVLTNRSVDSKVCNHELIHLLFLGPNLSRVETNIRCVLGLPDY